MNLRHVFEMEPQSSDGFDVGVRGEVSEESEKIQGDALVFGLNNWLDEMIAAFTERRKAEQEPGGEGRDWR